ncbi:hypothetical protein [Paenibacillus xylanivorans]|uniref:hypothetical protein n=1 Tax=Paenibacillus xylanivorans TaxID=1705561 RepID=UPI0006B19ADD|nr:hypothetical protein [Paenibacillus xylanivorans]
MSCELMVFDPIKAPVDKTSFMSWYGEQTKWSEDHSYSGIKVSLEALQRFYEELVLTFPSMNVDDDVLKRWKKRERIID